MDDLERVITASLRRIHNFGQANAPVVTANVKAAAAFAAIGQYIEQLDETGALRTSAGETKLTQTGFRRMKRTELNGFLIRMSNIARDIERNTPEFVNNFRVQRHNRNDSTLLESARAFYRDSETGAQDFIDYGLPPRFRETLLTLIDEFEAAINQQDSANRTRIGANATIDDIVDNALTGRRTLTIIVPNLFSDNPGKLAEWAAASHIEKLPRGTPRTPPQA